MTVSHSQPTSPEAPHLLALEAREAAYKARIQVLEDALRLAEDVLSRAPFSTALWPNGMHPMIGITQIRDALQPKAST